MRVELYMHQKDMPPNQAFNALMAKRSSIDTAYSVALDWRPLPDSVAARIAVHLPNADVADRADWPRQHAWIVAELAKFRRVFADRVKALRLDEVPGVDDADADPDEMV